jgi:membrane-bound serine protease (ClpP class)
MLDKKNFNLKGQNFEISLSRSIVSKFYEPTLGQKILYVLSNPSTAYFLFLIGVALMYFELQAPGGFIAGGIGICFLLLSAISFQVLPLDWGALALLIVGVVLLVLEVYITSYGLLALGGIAAFIAGSLFLFHGEGGYISIDYPVLISTILGIGFSTGVIIWYMLRDNARQAKHGDFFLPVGSEGSVMGKLEHGQLQIKVRGEIWRGSSENDLEIGDTVVVTSIDNEKLIAQVKKVNKE